MNKREAEGIADEIKLFMETWEDCGGIDSAMIIANMANEIFSRIIVDHPKIKAALEELYKLRW